MLAGGWPRDGVIDEWFEGALETVYARRYPNLTAIFAESLRAYGDDEIFIFPARGERYTRRRLDLAVRKAAASLIEDYGIEKGDRVAMVLLNNPEFCISYLAIAAVGAISVVVNARLEAEELCFQLRDSGARALIVEAELYERVRPLRERLEELKTVVVTGNEGINGCPPFTTLLAREAPACIGVEVNERDACSICYTSGTTGRPKGSIITHRNVVANAMAQLSCMPYLLPEGYGVEDISQIKQIISVPLYHVTALHTLFNLCLLGAGAVVYPVFQADEVIESMVAEEVNYFVGVTAMFWLLRMQPNYARLVEAGHLELMFQGGSPMPAELGELMHDRDHLDRRGLHSPPRAGDKAGHLHRLADPAHPLQGGGRPPAGGPEGRARRAAHQRLGGLPRLLEPSRQDQRELRRRRGWAPLAPLGRRGGRGRGGVLHHRRSQKGHDTQGRRERVFGGGGEPHQHEPQGPAGGGGGGATVGVATLCQMAKTVVLAVNV